MLDSLATVSSGVVLDTWCCLLQTDIIVLRCILCLLCAWMPTRWPKILSFIFTLCGVILKKYGAAPSPGMLMVLAFFRVPCALAIFNVLCCSAATMAPSGTKSRCGTIEFENLGCSIQSFFAKTGPIGVGNREAGSNGWTEFANCSISIGSFVCLWWL